MKMKIITRYKKTALSVMMLFGMSMNATEAAKCSPCQAAAAARRSAQDAAIAASLLAGKPISREMELDKDMVQACCEYCAQPGSFGCQGENSARCNVCQQGLLKKSIQEALAALVAAASVAKRMELDTSAPEKTARAPREAIVDPCNPCDTCDQAEVVCPVEQTDCCGLVNFIACQVQQQGRDARKCCKRIKHGLNDVEDLVESVLDQSVACCSTTDVQFSILDVLVGSQISSSDICCSVLDTRIGDLGGSAIDIPACADRFSIADVINGINDVDVVEWLKSLYILLFQVYQCTCAPCIEG
jgi:hypothetical protein